MNDICRAKALYESKRDVFKALTELYRDHVPQWNKADRTAHVSKKGKEVDSVYRQKTEKREFHVKFTCTPRLRMGTTSCFAVSCV